MRLGCIEAVVLRCFGFQLLFHGFQLLNDVRKGFKRKCFPSSRSRLFEPWLDWTAYI